MRTLLPLALAGLAACSPAAVPPGTAPGHRPTIAVDGAPEIEITRSRMDSEARIGAPAERLWLHLPGVYDELGLTGGGAVTGAQHTFTRRNLRVVRGLPDLPLNRMVNCGTSLHGDARYEVSLTVTTVLRADGEDRSRVVTTVDAEGRQIGSSNNPVHCASTGAIESRIVQRLQHRIATGGG
jgi:hypothetical protein